MYMYTYTCMHKYFLIVMGDGGWLSDKASRKQYTHHVTVTYFTEYQYQQYHFNFHQKRLDQGTTELKLLRLGYIPAWFLAFLNQKL